MPGKRAAEVEAGVDAAEGVEPDVKKAKLDAGAGGASTEAAAAPAEGEEAQMEDAGEAEGEEGAEEGAGAAAAAPGEPVTLGYRTFTTGAQAHQYIGNVLKNLTLGQDLNEYELVMVLDLLKKGHPRWEDKLAGGVSAVTVMETNYAGQTSRCFHLRRPDGTLEDFSYRKCLDAIFPELHLQDNTGRAVSSKPKGGRGGRGGRGRGGRGRGGGGRGRGRG